MDKFLTNLPGLITQKINYYHWKAQIDHVNQEYRSRVWLDSQYLLNTFFQDRLYWRQSLQSDQMICSINESINFPATKITRFSSENKINVVAEIPKNYYYSNGSEHELMSATRVIQDLFV